MKMTVSESRPCVLKRGEMRRVPQDRFFRNVVGYHVCCPRCGFVTAVLNGESGLVISESGDAALVTFSMPARCVFCNVVIHIHEGEATLEEDKHARAVQYRSPS